MTKRMKLLLIGVLILTVILCIAVLWFLFPEWSYIDSDIEKIYCKATLEDNFTEDTVLIVLTNEASLQYIDHDYTPADFAEIGCVEVKDLSSATTKKIRAQLNGETLPTGTRPGESWFNAPKDVTTFKRILSIKIKDASKLNVLLAIKILEHRADIYSAEPNYIFSLD